MPRLSILAIGIIFFCSDALLAGWSFIGSKHRELHGQTVAAVGELSKQERYDYKNSRSLEWYQFDDTAGDTICLTFLGYEPYLSGNQAALIVVDERKHFKLALIESTVGSIKISLEEVSAIECPSRY